MLSSSKAPYYTLGKHTRSPSPPESSSESLTASEIRRNPARKAKKTRTEEFVPSQTQRHRKIRRGRARTRNKGHGEQAASLSDRLQSEKLAEENTSNLPAIHHAEGVDVDITEGTPSMSTLNINSYYGEDVEMAEGASLASMSLGDVAGDSTKAPTVVPAGASPASTSLDEFAGVKAPTFLPASAPPASASFHEVTGDSIKAPTVISANTSLTSMSLDEVAGNSINHFLSNDSISAPLATRPSNSKLSNPISSASGMSILSSSRLEMADPLGNNPVFCGEDGHGFAGHNPGPRKDSLQGHVSVDGDVVSSILDMSNRSNGTFISTSQSATSEVMSGGSIRSSISPTDLSAPSKSVSDPSISISPTATSHGSAHSLKSPALSITPSAMSDGLATSSSAVPSVSMHIPNESYKSTMAMSDSTESVSSPALSNVSSHPSTMTMSCSNGSTVSSVSASSPALSSALPTAISSVSSHSSTTAMSCSNGLTESGVSANSPAISYASPTAFSNVSSHPSTMVMSCSNVSTESGVSASSPALSSAMPTAIPIAVSCSTEFSVSASFPAVSSASPIDMSTVPSSVSSLAMSEGLEESSVSAASSGSSMAISNTSKSSMIISNGSVGSISSNPRSPAASLVLSESLSAQSHLSSMVVSSAFTRSSASASSLAAMHCSNSNRQDDVQYLQGHSTSSTDSSGVQSCSDASESSQDMDASASVCGSGDDSAEAIMDLTDDETISSSNSSYHRSITASTITQSRASYDSLLSLGSSGSISSEATSPFWERSHNSLSDSRPTHDIEMASVTSHSSSERTISSARCSYASMLPLGASSRSASPLVWTSQSSQQSLQSAKSHSLSASGIASSSTHSSVSHSFSRNASDLDGFLSVSVLSTDSSRQAAFHSSSHRQSSSRSYSLSSSGLAASATELHSSRTSTEGGDYDVEDFSSGRSHESDTSRKGATYRSLYSDHSVDGAPDEGLPHSTECESSGYAAGHTDATNKKGGAHAKESRASHHRVPDFHPEDFAGPSEPQYHSFHADGASDNDLSDDEFSDDESFDESYKNKKGKARRAPDSFRRSKETASPRLEDYLTPEQIQQLTTETRQTLMNLLRDSDQRLLKSDVAQIFIALLSQNAPGGKSSVDEEEKPKLWQESMRRDTDNVDLASRIRAYMRDLLPDNEPTCVSAADLDRFIEDPNAGPTLAKYRLDLDTNHLLTSPWNLAAINIFVDAFLAEETNKDMKRKDVIVKLKGHMRHLHSMYRQNQMENSDDKQERDKASRTVNRRRELLTRRRDAIRGLGRCDDQGMAIASKAMEYLGHDAMSGDETDNERTRGKGPRKGRDRPRIRRAITVLDWRSQELGDFLRKLDACHIASRYNQNGNYGKGAFPDERYPSRRKERYLFTAPRGLPENFYDITWLRSLSADEKRALSIQPKVQLKLPAKVERLSKRFAHVKTRKTMPLPDNDPSLPPLHSQTS
ncbi:hypothetical protein VKT23_015916 [Stygiomarasmius scandens]|uniref:Uncharacterized protein n=1 Tax=Marasmiellus scandens TaxID=2682957 RepID=A0ABR1IWA4_9AGAR